MFRNREIVLTGEGDMFLPRQISAFKTAEQTINSVNEALIKNAESIDETITPPQELNQNDFVVPILTRAFQQEKVSFFLMMTTQSDISPCQRN